jgi:hypothetical protein
MALHAHSPAAVAPSVTATIPSTSERGGPGPPVQWGETLQSRPCGAAGRNLVGVAYIGWSSSGGSAWGRGHHGHDQPRRQMPAGDDAKAGSGGGVQVFQESMNSARKPAACCSNQSRAPTPMRKACGGKSAKKSWICLYGSKALASCVRTDDRAGIRYWGVSSPDGGASDRIWGPNPVARLIKAVAMSVLAGSMLGPVDR